MSTEQENPKPEIINKAEESIASFEKSKSYPLWLPKGSIRALLALFVVCTFCLLGLAKAFNIATAETSEVLGIFGPLAGYIIKDYISSRQETPERNKDQTQL